MRGRVLLIGTGGTIAGAAPSSSQTLGYTPGAIGVDALRRSIGAIADGETARIDLRTSQPFSIGSQHMTSAHWLALAREVDGASREHDAIVIAHGTDTMEETAFFLDLVCPRETPIVLTGAMRPATAISADGPSNLGFACLIGAEQAARGRGPLVAFCDSAWLGWHARKVHTLALDAFDGTGHDAQALRVSDAVAWRVDAEAARREAAARPAFDRQRIEHHGAPLPRVGLIAQHVDADPAIVDWHLSEGARGLVFAGTGQGTMPDAMRAALARASRAGCLVVRSTRVAGGPVIPDTEPVEADRDDALGFVASHWLPAIKARILLQCCLAIGLGKADLPEVRRRFDAYR
ncbi:MAG: asparaginase [Lautropia sp.]